MRKTTTITFLIILTLLVSCSFASAAPFDEGWQYRKEITIDSTKVTANLTDFPVLISITADAELASNAETDGTDIIFTGADGTTKLKYEIESYSGGTLVAWVKVPSLSSTTDTIVYMYYGNSTPPTNPDPEGVWDSNYVMVQHLDETAGTHSDSTINANDGTPVNVFDQGADGKIDGADEFDATGDLIDVGTDASLDVFGSGQDFSIFLWVKRDATTEVEGLFSSGSGGPNGIYFGSAPTNEDDLKFLSKTNTVDIESTTGAIGDTGWHHVGVTADRAGDLQFWVDGVSIHSEDISTTSTENWNRVDDTYKIGNDRSEASPMDGIIDEVRVSDMVRGTGWIQTSYTNQDAPGTFYSSIGDEEVCAVDADCDDSNVCTTDTCSIGTCSKTNNTASCDDGDPCTESDICTAGTCGGTALDCDDSEVCTDDSCVGGTCVYDNNTASCDDGDPCTESDICAAGTCGGTALDCDDSEVCTDDSCVGGTCVYDNNTASCDDGDPCTESDICAAGTCGGTALDCDDSEVCTDDSCVGGTCVYDNNTASCNDGDPCTESDICAAGTCGGTALDCDDSEVCTDDSCVGGTCVYDNNTASCDDGDPCTESDICAAGTCGGTALDCGDGDLCTQDICTAGVCSNPPVDCDDSEVCTDDSCVGGTCVYDNNTTSCDDGDPCTESDVCAAGTCGGTAVNCDDGIGCTVDTCDAGTCVNTTDDASCDDGEFCTGVETCDSVSDCQPGSGDPCVPNTCDEVNDICITSGWWDASWLFRKKITIDPAKVADDLTDFPVLIDITDDDLATYAQDDGDDLAFTDDNAMQLSHEIELYDDGTGHVVAWVRVPDVSSTEDTVLYLYFGNSTAGNQEDVAGTWDSGYVMVQHLDETSDTHFDSTINENDGTPVNVFDQDAMGKIDGADEFDDPLTPSEINVGTNTSMDVFGPNQDFSIFLWVKRASTLEVEGFFSSGSDPAYGIYFGSAYTNTDDLKFMSLGQTVEIESITNPINDTEWHLVGVTADRDGVLQLWVDGELEHSESIAGTASQDWNRADDTYKIATDRSENSPLDGIIDEVRLSDEVRSAGWIQTSYTNQNDPGAFYLCGPIEAEPDADGDGSPDGLDNCPNYPNGPLRGTCTEEVVGTFNVNWIVSTGQFCTVDADCDPGEFCETSQADNYPPGGNGIGDACDCEADFDCDAPGLDVDAVNVEQFLMDFGRSVVFDPCTDDRFCYGDFNCDGNVDADDIPKLLEDFGRNLYENKCPAPPVCVVGDWCTYVVEP